MRLPRIGSSRRNIDPNNGGTTRPGVSAFTRTGDRIERVSSSYFGPGDPYSGIWHLDAVFRGEVDWTPRFSYAKAGGRRGAGTRLADGV